MFQLIDSSRRGFFKKLFLGMAGATAAARGALSAHAETSASAGGQPGSAGGYRETEHIRNYYEKARF
ncbi:MAG: formate dehydrogenase [Gammaproteobacteria bacterium]